MTNPASEPNFTRVPNYIIEAMPTMKEAELRVVLAVARKTIGWQKECDVISVTQLEKATGMHRQGVQNGIDDAIKHGFLKREPAKRNSFCYRLFHEVEYSTNTTIPQSGTELFHEVEQKRPQLFHEVETQKKESKEKKESKNARAKDNVFEAIADVCKIDLAVCSFEQRQQLNQSAGILRRAAEKAGTSEEGLVSRIHQTADFFYMHDWRGKKNQPLTPKLLRDIWRQAHESLNGKTNGTGQSHKKPAVNHTRAMTPEEMALGGDDV